MPLVSGEQYLDLKNEDPKIKAIPDRCLSRTMQRSSRSRKLAGTQGFGKTADTPFMVDLARRWLAAYRAKQEAALKARLVCGSKISDMHPLALDSPSVVNFEKQNPGIDMTEQLKKFAVCHDCVIQFQGQRHRVAFAVDPSLRKPTIHRAFSISSLPNRQKKARPIGKGPNRGSLYSASLRLALPLLPSWCSGCSFVVAVNAIPSCRSIGLNIFTNRGVSSASNKSRSNRAPHICRRTAPGGSNRGAASSAEAPSP